MATATRRRVIRLRACLVAMRRRRGRTLRRVEQHVEEQADCARRRLEENTSAHLFIGSMTGGVIDDGLREHPLQVPQPHESIDALWFAEEIFLDVNGVSKLRAHFTPPEAIVQTSSRRR